MTEAWHESFAERLDDEYAEQDQQPRGSFQADLDRHLTDSTFRRAYERQTHQLAAQAQAQARDKWLRLAAGQPSIFRVHRPKPFQVCTRRLCLRRHWFAAVCPCGRFGEVFARWWQANHALYVVHIYDGHGGADD